MRRYLDYVDDFAKRMSRQDVNTIRRDLVMLEKQNLHEAEKNLVKQAVYNHLSFGKRVRLRQEFIEQFGQPTVPATQAAVTAAVTAAPATTVPPVTVPPATVAPTTVPPATTVPPVTTRGNVVIPAAGPNDVLGALQGATQALQTAADLAIAQNVSGYGTRSRTRSRKKLTGRTKRRRRIS